MSRQSNVDIRKALVSDIPALSHVQAEAWQETYAGLLPDDFNRIITPEFIRSVRGRVGVSTTFVAVMDGELVGFCDYLPHERHNPERGYPELASLYVLRAAQGMGLGRCLVEQAVAEMPAGPVSLLVFEGNTRAIGFYNHLGFRPTGICLEDSGVTEVEMILA